MKAWIPLAAFSFFFLTAVPAEADYPSRFRGVCQHCGYDLMAYWRPVECHDGRVVSQWVNECHDHCRPTYLPRKRRDFFNSHLMNPANPKRNAKRNCLPNASTTGIETVRASRRTCCP